MKSTLLHNSSGTNVFRAALVTFEVSPKYTNHFKKNWLEMDAKQNISSIRHFLKIRHWVSDVTFSQECALLTQWRFFKKCRIEDIFCFVSVLTNLRANYKRHLGHMCATLVPELSPKNVFFHGEPTVKPKLLPSTSISRFKTYLSRCVWSLRFGKIYSMACNSLFLKSSIG